MKKNNLQEIKKNIDISLKSKLISGKTILDRFLVIDEESRKTAPYLDFSYATFYYYLGKVIKPRSVFEIGFDLGLLSSSFFLSCDSCEFFFGFKEKEENLSLRLGKRNINSVFKKQKKYHFGNLYDDEMNFSNHWDLFILNTESSYDKQLQYLEFCYESLSEDGLIVVEYFNSHEPSKKSLLDFCDNKKLEFISFETRYGTAIIKK
ncbi:MAG: hypothetical protein EKK64_10485 [Neisseriaceae bacterium]|nr:MAG: hypothetical protein EKK64_10485 [Neisseriaceae bacterium]